MPDVAAAMPQPGAVVVTGHHDEVDASALRAALEQGTAHMGAMGSRQTQARRLEWLTENGVGRTSSPASTHPVALDIDADTLAEIALPILAELVATVRPRTEVGSIKDRERPIPSRPGAGRGVLPYGVAHQPRPPNHSRYDGPRVPR
jgi:xanthine/CO dehydrogenase XdhC/CoxF family maturation factor